jgi:hypothetical protein
MKIGRGNRSSWRKPAPAPLCPHINPTWPDPGSNPGRRDGKPATNRLSYGAATLELLCSRCSFLLLISISHCWTYVNVTKSGHVGNCNICNLVQAGFLLGLFFDPQNGGDLFLGKLTFNGLHGVISQRKELFRWCYCSPLSCQRSTYFFWI